MSKTNCSLSGLGALDEGIKEAVKGVQGSIDGRLLNVPYNSELHTAPCGHNETVLEADDSPALCFSLERQETRAPARGHTQITNE